ncbi:MAG: hypothetical protein ACLGHW_03275 [Gammaproteobacteria bacterium]
MLPAIARCATALLLAGACAAVPAREIQLHGANGDGGSCPEINAARAKAEDKAELHSSGERPQPVAPAARGTPSAQGESGGGGNRMQAPRWHSFLPGMFR